MFFAIKLKKDKESKLAEEARKAEEARRIAEAQRREEERLMEEERKLEAARLAEQARRNIELRKQLAMQEEEEQKRRLSRNQVSPLSFGNMVEAHLQWQETYGISDEIDYEKIVLYFSLDDVVVLHVHIADMAVIQNGQIFLRGNQFFHRTCVVSVEGRIYVTQATDLFGNSPLTRINMRYLGTVHSNSHLVAGIAPQHGTVVD